MTARPIQRLLIANRGEIAVRIAKTAHRMGISTVGVYAEPDASALHVDVVDVAMALGGSTPAESYLRGDAVLEAAVQQGCDAVHPGYGFLAENAAFAQAVIDAGLIWVGPTPEQIRLLGDKVQAKEAAIAAGVPTSPIFAAAPGQVPDDVPMPALVKAAAGGGGRGMRVVRAQGELADAIEAAAREAQSSFGDATVFIEPYIARARHIEVQIMGDSHGTVLHLGERECSVQRRNQKVIEESPSAGISDDVRRRLTDGALALARHVGYQNAGTVEFLVGTSEGADGALPINFLEVNTRLQVEHPVTEMVTGLDLVEMQLRVAAGEPLGISQSDISVQGHAIEVRLVAEDPSNDWLPSTGTIDAFSIDEELVRVDTGFRPGAVISPDYDSLLAKVIAYASSREQAAATLARALRTATVTGVRTNLASSVAILGEADFLAAQTPTAYLADHPAVVSDRGPRGDDLHTLLIGATLAVENRHRRADKRTGFAPSGWRNLRTQGQRQRWILDDSEVGVEYVISPHGDLIDVLIGDWPVPDDDGVLADDERQRRKVRRFESDSDRQVVEIDGRRTVVTVAISGDLADPHAEAIVHASSRAGTISLVQPPRFLDHEIDQAGGGPVCPLPGTVIAVHVADGDRVVNGQLLMIVEAMKMEHKINAVGDAVVDHVRFGVGDRVDAGDLLVSLSSDP